MQGGRFTVKYISAEAASLGGGVYFFAVARGLGVSPLTAESTGYRDPLGQVFWLTPPAVQAWGRQRRGAVPVCPAVPRGDSACTLVRKQSALQLSARVGAA